MSNITPKAVFLDELAIGAATTTKDAISVLRRYAAKRRPDAAIHLIIADLGVERPERWRPEEHLSEGRDGFYFDVGFLKGDHP